MKKVISVILVGFATLFLTACGGGSSGGDSTPPITVNLIGTWDYGIITQNSICDGKLAQGIEIIEPLDGDSTKIGNVIVQGTGFAVDGNQNCYLTSVDETTSRSYGYPSTMTADEFLAFGEAQNAGDNTIKELRVDSFNNYKIVTSTEYTNGVIIRSTLTR